MGIGMLVSPHDAATLADDREIDSSRQFFDRVITSSPRSQLKNEPSPFEPARLAQHLWVSIRVVLIAAFLLTLLGCASIPPEAPELSAQLGGRITEMEAAHRRLVGSYFLEKRNRIDEFIQKEWVPELARQFFGDPVIAKTWTQVVQSADPNDRIQFILIAGPKLQATINAKRDALIQPLDQLEAAVQGRLADEYNNMRSINGSLTSFLQSAAEVDENRKRYLDMMGVKDSSLKSFVDDTDSAVSELVEKADSVELKTQQAESFAEQVKKIISKVTG